MNSNYAGVWWSFVMIYTKIVNYFRKLHMQYGALNICIINDDTDYNIQYLTLSKIAISSFIFCLSISVSVISFIMSQFIFLSTLQSINSLLDNIG